MLNDPKDWNRHQQYVELNRVLSPIIRAYGINDSMSWISNPLDRRSMGFWMIRPSFSALRIKNDFDASETGVTSHVWVSVNDDGYDHLGRFFWNQIEIDIHKGDLGERNYS